MQPAVSVQNISKQFVLHHQINKTFREALLRLFQVRELQRERFWALNNVSFDVGRGETLGIIGENGSGKSTLLRLILGLTPPTKGQIVVNGHLSAILELAAGFHPDLTGKENIYLNGAILGLRQAEISKNIGKIIEFAELEKFSDVPVKHYSAGMYLRLGFSIAVNIEPDILLIDEVLAVGDQSFSQKCLAKINDFKRRNKTIIFVSHDLSTVEQICDRVIHLDKGVIKETGNAKHIIQKYLRNIIEQDLVQTMQEDGTQKIKTMKTPVRWGTGEIQVVNVKLFDENHQEKFIFHPGDQLVVELEYNAYQPVIEPYFGIAIEMENREYITGANTRIKKIKSGTISGKGKLSVTYSHFNVTGGKYVVTVGIFRDPSNQNTAYDYFLCGYSFFIDGSNTEEEGLVLIPQIWKFEKD